ILRVPPSGDRIEQFTPQQGCDVDVVRGLAATDKGILAVGEGAGEPRAALYDGVRFYSYKIAGPSLLEWATRAGSQLLLGAGDTAYTLKITHVTPETPAQPDGPIRFEPTHSALAKEGKLVNLSPNLASSALDDPGPPTIKPPAKGGQLPPRLTV